MEVGAERAVLLTGHCLFWALVAARVVASRGAHSQADPAAPAGTDAAAVPRKARLALMLTAVAMAAYYVVLGVWWIGPRLAGPALLGSSPSLTIVGAALMACGLVLVGWAYLVLRSFRLLAALEREHELCTRGPFALVRHPVYSGMMLLYLGSFVVVSRVAFAIPVAAIVFASDWRAHLEEEALRDRYGAEYRVYSERTGRFLPRIFRRRGTPSWISR